MCSPKTRVAYLRDNDWRGELWSLVFVLGVIIGAFVAAHYLSNSAVHLLPDHYRQWSGGLRLFIGGLFVGFGTRYADGCISGHSIMGLSNLKWPSLLATACFFIGGMVSIVVLMHLSNALGPYCKGAIDESRFCPFNGHYFRHGVG